MAYDFADRREQVSGYFVAIEPGRTVSSICPIKPREGKPVGCTDTDGQKLEWRNHPIHRNRTIRFCREGRHWNILGQYTDKILRPDNGHGVQGHGIVSVPSGFTAIGSKVRQAGDSC